MAHPRRIAGTRAVSDAPARAVDPAGSEQDAIEASLRPQILAEFVGQRQPRTDPLHRRQPPEPVALGRIEEAVERDRILAHDGLDQHGRSLANDKITQGARRGRQEIADTVHVDDGPVGSDQVEDAGELGDHPGMARAAMFQARRVSAWWA